MPKKNNSANINKFCHISFLNTEEKVFFRILVRRLTVYLEKNTAVQKAGVQGFSACLEHTRIIQTAKIMGETSMLCSWILWTMLSYSAYQNPLKPFSNPTSRTYSSA